MDESSNVVRRDTGRDVSATVNGASTLGKGLNLEVHLDTDEGNACDLANAKGVELLKM